MIRVSDIKISVKNNVDLEFLKNKVSKILRISKEAILKIKIAK